MRTLVPATRASVRVLTKNSSRATNDGQNNFGVEYLMDS